MNNFLSCYGLARECTEGLWLTINKFIYCVSTKESVSYEVSVVDCVSVLCVFVFIARLSCREPGFVAHRMRMDALQRTVA